MRLSTRLKNIISGTCPRLSSKLIRTALTIPAACYSCIISIRNLLYDKGLLKTHRLPVPVICVGNITTGGTGKTPMVLWLCRFFQAHNITPAILTRGYKSTYDQSNDETQLLQAALPDVPIIIDSDRVRGGQDALQTHKPQVLIMDDGFQHRRLHRDLDIVLIDATNPFGYNYLLPRGLLREPKHNLSRASIAILTRTDQIEPDQLKKLNDQVSQLINMSTVTDKLIIPCRHTPTALIDKDGTNKDLDQLSDKKIFAFCGLGNPDAFAATLQTLGVNSVTTYTFDDHHHFNDTDIKFIRDLSTQTEYDMSVTTEKDWVKLSQLTTIKELTNLHWLKIEIAITDKQQEFEDRLSRLCSKTENESKV
ncbi:MAG: tetraacyldisaccharide 4'-kinase [Planctomycetes bacterium]|nr:tetraacyldisaccharide 4'-kinase [Planctomycetota bacterium]